MVSLSAIWKISIRKSKPIKNYLFI